MKAISQESKLTLSVALGVGTLLIGLAFWTGQSYMMVLHNRSEIKIIKRDIEQERRIMYEKMGRLSDNISEANGRLDTIIRLLENKKKE